MGRLMSTASFSSRRLFILKIKDDILKPVLEKAETFSKMENKDTDPKSGTLGEINKMQLGKDSVVPKSLTVIVVSITKPCSLKIRCTERTSNCNAAPQWRGTIYRAMHFSVMPF